VGAHGSTSWAASSSSGSPPPDADPGDEPDGGDIASSAWSLAEESLALKARKAFEDVVEEADAAEE
jgi:hypothetical protein